VGPDGALYITDDKAGRVWRVTYHGDADAPLEAAPTSSTQAEASPNALAPEGVRGAAGALASLPLPPGATAEQVALGKKIFGGEIAGGTCAGCHGANGIGSPLGADLASGKWLWGDGSLKSITDTIKTGLPQPKQHPGAMQPYGGVHLSDSELAAVAAYVWAIGHQKKGRTNLTNTVGRGDSSGSY
jgi:mono/diheme cytochrome c family protein